MPKYIFDGTEFSLEELQFDAEQAGLNFEEYLKKYNIEVIPDEELGNQTDPAMEAAAAGSNKPAATDSVSENGLSELPEPDPNDYVVADGNVVFRADYAESLKNDPSLPATFEDYAKAFNAEILSTKESKITTQRPTINFELTTPELPANINAQGFKVQTSKVDDPDFSERISAGIGLSATAAPKIDEYTITANNGETFTFYPSKAKDTAELNAFLNANKPSDGFSKTFITDHNFTTEDLYEFDLNGEVKSPDYKFLNTISNTMDKVLEYYSGMKKFAFDDTEIVFDNFLTFAESPESMPQDVLLEGVRNSVISTLEKKGIINRDNTDMAAVVDIIDKVFINNNYANSRLQEIALRKQGERFNEYGDIDLPEDQKNNFINIQIASQSDLDTRRAAELNRIVLNTNKQLKNTELSEEERSKLLFQRDRAYEVLKNVQPSREGIVKSEIAKGTFTDAFGDLATKKKFNFEDLSEEEQLKFVLSIIDEETGLIKQSILDDAAAGNKTAAEALEEQYDFMIKEHIGLKSYADNTTLNLTERQLNFYKNRIRNGRTALEEIQEALGRDNVATLTLSEYLKLEEQVPDFALYGGSSLSPDWMKPSEVKLYKSKKQQLAKRKMVLNELYLFNTDPATISVSKGELFFDSAYLAIPGTTEARKKDYQIKGDKNRFKLDAIQEYADSFNLINKERIKQGIVPAMEFTPEQKENFKRDFGQHVAEIGGGFVPVMAEFALLGAVAGAIHKIPRIARYLQSLSEARTAGTLAAEGITKEALTAAETKTLVQAGLEARAKFLGIETIEEGLKFTAIDAEKAYGSPEGFIEAFSTGALFKLGATAAAGKIGRFEGNNAFFNQHVDAAFGGGIGASAGSHLSQIGVQYGKALLNDADFNLFIKETYGQDDSASRIAAEALVFTLLGPIGVATKSKAGRSRQAFVQETEKINDYIDKGIAAKVILQKFLDSEGITKENQAEIQKEINDLDFHIKSLEKYNKYRIYDAKYRLDNPNLEKDVYTFVNNQLREVNTEAAKGKKEAEVKIQFVDSWEQINYDRAEDASAATDAYWSSSQNTIYFVKSEFNRGVMIHETTHAAVSKYLSEPGRMAVFKEKIISSLEKYFGEQGTTLINEINKKYNLDLEKLEDKSISDEEFIAFVVGIFSGQGFSENFLSDKRNQTLWGEISSTVGRLIERSSDKANRGPETVLYLLRKIAGSAKTGKDASKAFDRLLPLILENSTIPADKARGASSRRLTNEEAYAEYSKVAELYEKGEATTEEADLALAQYEAILKENRRASEVVPETKATAEPAGKVDIQTILETKDLTPDQRTALEARQKYLQELNNKSVGDLKTAQELIDFIGLKQKGSTEQQAAIEKLKPQFINILLRSINFSKVEGNVLSKQDAVQWIEENLFYENALQKYSAVDAEGNISTFSNFVNSFYGRRGSTLYKTIDAKVSTSSIDTETGTIELADTATETFTDNISSETRKGKGTAPGKLMGVEYDAKAEAEVQRKLENIDLSNESLSSLEGLASETISEFTGVSESQLFSQTSNLTNETRYEIIKPDGKKLRDENGEPVLKYKKGLDSYLKKNPGAKQGATIPSESEKLRQAIIRMGKNFLSIFPELNIVAELRGGEPYYDIPGEKEIIGRSVGLPGTLTKYLYSELINPKTGKPFRGKNPASQTIVQNLDNLSFEGLARLINKVRGEKFERPENVTDKEWLKIQRDNQQFLKGLFQWYNKMTTNEIVRRDANLLIATRVALEAGKPRGMAAKKLGGSKVDSFEEALKKAKNYISENAFESVEKSIRNILITEQDPIKQAELFLDVLNSNFGQKIKFRAYTREIIPFLQKTMGNATEGQALELIGKFRKIFDNESTEAGYSTSKLMLETQIYSAKENISLATDPVLKAELEQRRDDAVLSWLKNYSRGGRTGGFDPTNSLIYKNVIKPLFKISPELAKNFGSFEKVIINSKTNKKEKRSYITYKGKIVGGYAEINEIKADFEGMRSTINAEAKEARSYIWEKIDFYLSQMRKGDAIDFINFISIDQRGPLRKVAEAGFSMRSAKFNNSTLEHETEVKDMADALKRYVKNPTRANRIEAEQLIENSKVNLVTTEFDAALRNAKTTLGVSSKARYTAEPVQNLYKTFLSQGEIVTAAAAAGGRASKKISITKEVSDRITSLVPEVTGEVSRVVASQRGKEVDSGFLPNILKFKVDPEAQDFIGLMQNLVPKGKEGERVQQLHKELFTDPFNIASNKLDADQIRIAADYKSIRKFHKISDQSLQEKIGKTPYRQEDAVRVWIWNKFGHKIPGLSEVEKTNLISHVNSNPNLKSFAQEISKINGKKGFAEPGDYWFNTGLKADIQDALIAINRPGYLKKWQANVDDYFTEGNLNKMEAAFGTRWRKAMVNSLYRQTTGKNRHYSVESQVGQFENALSGAVLNTLHWNNKSALLQLTSAVNFINWTDNNPLAAGKAFANQKQYWEDVKFLFNSEFLKQRRSGLTMDLNDADIAEAASTKGFMSIQAKLLKFGMTPTVIADNIAIAGGGATFYRNRINTYIRQGLTVKAAETKAYNDWRENAETSQQSSRADKLSMQQTGPLGRIVLAYTNTPQQYFREVNKAYNNLINRRGDDKTNVSKMLYYGSLANFLFTGLQQGVNAAIFAEDEVEIPSVMSDEEFKEFLINQVAPQDRAEIIKNRKAELKEIALLEKENKKKVDANLNTINSMMDTTLKGLGLQGAVLATLKGAAYRAYLESNKDRPDYRGTIPTALLGIAPGVSIKYSQIQRGIGTMQYNWKEIRERGLADFDNPIYAASADVIAGTTNFTANRYLQKINNVRRAVNDEYSEQVRVLSFGGWSEYALGIPREKWQKLSDEEIINLEKAKREQLLSLPPYLRAEYFAWKKEFEKRQKEKNK